MVKAFNPYGMKIYIGVGSAATATPTFHSVGNWTSLPDLYVANCVTVPMTVKQHVIYVFP